MKLLLLGDILGRSGREVVQKQVPKLRDQWGLDFVLVNGENAAGGFGITQKICQQLYDIGIHCITGGNHSWDQQEIVSYIDRDPKLLRPANLPGQPGRGVGEYQTADGKKVVVINLIGQVEMAEYAQNPFLEADKILESYKLGANADVILVDFHGEATSEKYAMGRYLDGRVSAVVGTHTHVPTADTRILSGGTAFQCDIGMCGDYDSVIGMDPEIPLKKFLTKMRAGKMIPASGEATLSGMYVETDGSGRAVRAEPVRIGGKLGESLPEGL